MAEPDLDFREFCRRQKVSASSERSWDAYEAERHRRGERDTHPGYTQRVQFQKELATRRADEIIRAPRDGAKLTHRHLDGTIRDGPACGLHYDGEQPLPLVECRFHGLVDDDHFPCRAPGESAELFTARCLGEIRDV